MLINLLDWADMTLIWTETTDLWITMVAADGKVGPSLVAKVLTPQSFYFRWLGGVGAATGTTEQDWTELRKAELSLHLDAKAEIRFMCYNIELPLLN